MVHYQREHKNLAKESIGLCESKYHNPLFHEQHSKLVDRRKQTELWWLQGPGEVGEDDLSNVRWEASRHFRDKKQEYLKDKINVLVSNIKNKNIRDLYLRRVINLELTSKG
jgi:hypothetical protein